MVLCRVSSSRDRKNLVGAVGQEVWQQEYMLASEQIVWSARWKVCWWSLWLRCRRRVDWEVNLWEVLLLERAHPGMGHVKEAIILEVVSRGRGAIIETPLGDCH